MKKTKFVVLCEQLVSSSIVFLKFIHIAAHITTSLLLTAKQFYYVFATFCLFIYKLIDIWIVSTFWILWILRLWIFVHTLWCRHIVTPSFMVVSVVRTHLPMQDMQVHSIGWEDTLEKELAAHSSILVWETPRTEEPGRVQSTGSHKNQIGHSD